jgi:phage shock protein C
MHKRLTRKTDDKLMAGVISGLARYFQQDPVLFRLAAVVLMLLSGIFPFVIVYFIAWIIMPPDDGVQYEVRE